jgi:hypothetical protein
MIPAMPFWAVFVNSTNIVSEPLIEIWRLKAVAVQNDQVTAAIGSFRLGRLQQFPAVSLTPIIGMNPQKLNLTTAAPGIAGDSGNKVLLVILHKYGQRPIILKAGRADVVLVDLVFKELKLNGIRMGLNDKLPIWHNFSFLYCMVRAAVPTPPIVKFQTQGSIKLRRPSCNTNFVEFRFDKSSRFVKSRL